MFTPLDNFASNGARSSGALFLTRLTKEQKEKIDNWLEENSLNRYGDPADTMYTGGTPLFNEATGESLDRYDYILKNHPDLLVFNTPQLCCGWVIHFLKLKHKDSCVS